MSQKDPERAKEIIEAKQEQWTEVADKIKEEDPEAYEHLTGERSETRVGYAVAVRDWRPSCRCRSCCSPRC